MGSRASLSGYWMEHTFEIIDAFAIEYTGPVLDTGLGASEESNHIDHLRRCFTLLLGSRHVLRHKPALGD